MSKIKITLGEFVFVGRLEEKKSPETCKWFLSLLPFEDTMIHVSWSGQACFVRLGDRGHGVPFENATSRPTKGQIMVYPGNVPHLQMGGEIFLAWGGCKMACPNGNIPGNHLLTIVEGIDNLEAFGTKVHLEGEQKVRFEVMGG